jgi:hypothetical protein
MSVSGRRVTIGTPEIGMTKPYLESALNVSTMSYGTKIG